jgi:hypothetical protein
MERFKQIVREMVDEEPIRSLDLKFLGAGSNRVAFETSGSDKKIIKINRNVVEEKLLKLLGILSDDIISDEDLKKEQRREIAIDMDIEDGIVEYFGADHVLKHGVFKTKVPFTKKTIAKFFEEDNSVSPIIGKLDDGFVCEVEMFAETQTKAEELIDRDKFNTKDFRTYRLKEEHYFEAENVPDALAEIRSLVDDELLSKFDEKFSDEKYLEVVKEIVTKIIGYIKKTGLGIDILGPNNITIFTKEDGSVGYHLLDVIMPCLAETNIKDDPEFKLLLNYYTLYYSIKSLADKLGIEADLEAEDLMYFKGVGIPTEGKLALE